jgi:hypothetical protein
MALPPRSGGTRGPASAPQAILLAAQRFLHERQHSDQSGPEAQLLPAGMADGRECAGLPRPTGSRGGARWVELPGTHAACGCEGGPGGKEAKACPPAKGLNQAVFRAAHALKARGNLRAERAGAVM